MDKILVLMYLSIMTIMTQMITQMFTQTSNMEIIEGYTGIDVIQI